MGKSEVLHQIELERGEGKCPRFKPTISCSLGVLYRCATTTSITYRPLNDALKHHCVICTLMPAKRNAVAMFQVTKNNNNFDVSIDSALLSQGRNMSPSENAESVVHMSNFSSHF